MSRISANSRSVIDYFLIGVKGLAMGAADVVPGVSGGTIAFITGIYEELIHSLSTINLQALKKLKTEGIGSAWKHINGNFFLSLFIGIGISIFSLAKLVTFLLDQHPVLLWSFFFGLVIASFILVARTIEKWSMGTVFLLILGTLLAGYISSLTATANGEELWFVFLSGAVAICAMILPGISGAFILVLMGSYHPIMVGIKTLDIKVIAVFLSGCFIGLLSFSKLLNFLFEHFKQLVLALLSGFLLGSLVKIWPWKNKVSDVPLVVHSDGREEFMMGNVFPAEFKGDPLLVKAVLFAIVGLTFVLLIDRLGKRLNPVKDVT